MIITSVNVVDRQILSSIQKKCEHLSVLIDVKATLNQQLFLIKLIWPAGSHLFLTSLIMLIVKFFAFIKHCVTFCLCLLCT